MRQAGKRVEWSWIKGTSLNGYRPKDQHALPPPQISSYI